jgi:hypothetical protein
MVVVSTANEEFDFATQSLVTDGDKPMPGVRGKEEITALRQSVTWVWTRKRGVPEETIAVVSPRVA